MKKSILILTSLICISGTVFTGCQSSAKKVENAEDKLANAKDDVADAQRDLIKARQDSIADYQQFKKESEEKFQAHEKSIADFKARIAKEKSDKKEAYEKEIARLEQKDTDMRKRLEDYNEVNKEKWETFKKNFNHELDELGESLKKFSSKDLR